MNFKALITLLACSFPVYAESPNSNDATSTTKANKEVASCCANKAKLAATEISKTSIYQIESSWKKQSGDSVKLVSLQGKIQVVTMGYSKCAYACPRLMADMKAVQLGLPAGLSEKVGFNFFSVDPTDSASSLKEFGNKYKVDFTHWSFFNASPDTIQELAVVLGTNYRRINDIDFAHSNLITVLNEKGEIIFRQEGLSVPAEPIITAIIAATK